MTTTIAAISGNDMVEFVIMLLVAGLVFWLLTWLIGYIGVGEPFTKIAKAVVAIVAVLFVIHALLSLTGHRLFG